MKPDYAYTMITVWSIADDVAVCQTKNSVSTSPTVQMMIRWILRSATWRLITTSRHIQRLTSSLLLPQLKVLSTLCPEMWITTYTLIPAITRHSLVRVKGEVFVLLYVFLLSPPPTRFFLQPLPSTTRDRPKVIFKLQPKPKGGRKYANGFRPKQK